MWWYGEAGMCGRKCRRPRGSGSGFCDAGFTMNISGFEAWKTRSHTGWMAPSDSALYQRISHDFYERLREASPLLLSLLDACHHQAGPRTARSGV